MDPKAKMEAVSTFTATYIPPKSPGVRLRGERLCFSPHSPAQTQEPVFFFLWLIKSFSWPCWNFCPTGLTWLCSHGAGIRSECLEKHVTELIRYVHQEMIAGCGWWMEKQRAVWDNVSARGKPRPREKEQQEGSMAQDSDVIFVPPGRLYLQMRLSCP